MHKTHQLASQLYRLPTFCGSLLTGKILLLTLPHITAALSLAVLFTFLSWEIIFYIPPNLQKDQENHMLTETYREEQTNQTDFAEAHKEDEEWFQMLACISTKAYFNYNLFLVQDSAHFLYIFNQLHRIYFNFYQHISISCQLP